MRPQRSHWPLIEVQALLTARLVTTRETPRLASELAGTEWQSRAPFATGRVYSWTSPPSGLDAASEELVFDAIDRLIEGKTAIRDRLLALNYPAGAPGSVVQDGRIVESGSHEPLLGPGGLYARL